MRKPAEFARNKPVARTLFLGEVGERWKRRARCRDRGESTYAIWAQIGTFREAKCGYLTGFLSAAEEAIDFYVRLAIEIFAQALG